MRDRLPFMAKNVDDLLRDARARYERIDARAAAGEVACGDATIVDTRPRELREATGDIPGAIPIGLNVLEWRLDPASEWHIPQVAGHETRIILLCQEGYSSSLTVARLLDLGLHRATDIIGGHDGWRAAGLPVVPFDPAAVPDRPVA